MTDLVGQSLGRYHILEQLGEGGMAVVYKAYDTRLETDVAVKVIRTESLPQNTVERALKRFEREAKALAKLNHQYIVKVMDYGEYDGKPYLVMPFFTGGTLKKKLGKPIGWQEAVKLLLPIAEALDYAHSQKMVHRDVKPANILLTERGQPMLTDFGIAKVLDIEETMDLTGTSAAVGTPEYMAPEQATAKTADHRADIYALGIVLYEMITGRKPYSADTPMAVLIMHARDPLPRPSKFVSGITNAVEKLLIKALAKSPDNRYQSMAEMFSAMEGLLGGRRKEPAKTSVLRKKKKIEKPEISISKPRTSLRTIILKAAPFFRMAGIILIVIVLLWGGSLAMPYFLSLVPTAKPRVTITPTITPIPPTKTLGSTSTKAKIPTSTTTPIPQSSILLLEDFEDNDVSDEWSTAWEIKVDENGNHYWLATGTNHSYPSAWLSRENKENWTNYALETRVKVINGELFLNVRDSGINSDGRYVAWISEKDDWVSMAQYTEPPSNFDEFSYAGKNHKIDPDIWYDLRLEVTETYLSFFIDNKRVTYAYLPKPAISSYGSIGFFIKSGDEIYLDDIRVWELP
jgi:serine/threonine protein kinase